MKINIMNILSRLMTRLRNYLRTVAGLPGFRLYMILLPLFILLFLVITFPYDVIILRSLRSTDGRIIRNLSMNELDAPLIGLWKGRFITASFRSDGDLSIREVNLDLSLIRALAGRYVGGLEISGGRIRTSSFSADTNGSCNFDLKTMGKAALPVNGNLRIMLDSLQLRLGTITLPENMGGLPIEVPPCRIDALMARLELKGSKISIREGTVTGNDLRGSVSGTVEMAGGSAVCDLAVTVDPDSTVLEKFRPFLGSLKNGKGKIEFMVRGPLPHPRIETAQTGGMDRGGQADRIPDLPALPVKPPAPGSPDDDDVE